MMEACIDIFDIKVRIRRQDRCHNHRYGMGSSFNNSTGICDGALCVPSVELLRLFLQSLSRLSDKRPCCGELKSQVGIRSEYLLTSTWSLIEMRLRRLSGKCRTCESQTIIPFGNAHTSRQPIVYHNHSCDLELPVRFLIETALQQ